MDFQILKIMSYPFRFLKILAIFAIAAISLSCSRRIPEAVEYPHISFRNTLVIEITRIERSDTSTIVSMTSFSHPRSWFRFSPDTYLLADGTKYKMTGADGIVPGEETYTKPVDDYSGRLDFKLFFEPLPAYVRECAIMEGEEEGDFKFYGIDLTGKAPKQLKAHDISNAKIPQPYFDSGETTVEVSIGYALGDLPKPNISLYVNSMFPPEQQEYTAQLDEDGKAVFHFWQNGTGYCFVLFGSNMGGGDIMTRPSETVRVFLDAGCRHATWESFSLAESEPLYTKVDGIYGPWCEAQTGKEAYTFNIYDGTFAKDAQTASDYMQVVRDTYESKMAQLAKNDSIAPLRRTAYENYIRNEVVAAVVLCNQIRRLYFQMDGGQREDYQPVHFSSEDCDWLSGIGLDKPEMALAGEEYFNLIDPEGIFSRFVPVPEGSLLAEVKDAMEYVGKIKGGELLDAAELAHVDSIHTPMLRDGIRHLQQEMEKMMEAVPSSVKETPDVPDDKLLDAILARYAGEPVLVDFWATWCSPCRAAMRAIEPLKETRFKGLRQIYITSTTSPKDKWLEMIPDIHGDHYYLTEQQMHTIFTQIGSNAYPTYLLIEKDGTRKEMVIGYDGEGMLNKIDALLK